jgi:hypothetical protein
MSYEYWQSEPGLWTVGTRETGGQDAKVKLHPESDWDTPEGAAERVAMLNGRPAPAPDPAAYLSDALDVLRDVRELLEQIRDAVSHD